MRVLRAFASAFAYFTILPVPKAMVRAENGPDALALSFLPIVGGVVGGLAGLIGWAVWLRAPGFSAIAAWIAAIALTGAIHVDGFLDSCDALLATATPQRRLDILRDPRHGTFAIVGMAMLAVVWLTALAAIAPGRLALVMAFAATTSRLAAVANAWVFPYARDDGMKPAFAVRPNAVAVACGVLLAAALAWRIAPPAIALIPAAIAVALLLGVFAKRRLSAGITGDVYGAVVVVVDVLLLLALRGA